jgi:ABC-type transporter MlaC component
MAIKAITEKMAAKEKDMERTNAMKKISMIIAAVALVWMFGCKNQSNSTASNATPDNNNESLAQQTSLSPEDLGELGAKIKRNPKDAERLLSEKGLTERQFEKAVRKVAESPEQSKRYAEAYKKAS